MQFLISVIDDGQAERAGRDESATEAEMAAIDVFNDRLQTEGHWIFAGGIGSPDQATIIDNRGGDPLVSRGPLFDSPSFIAGFWVIEAVDLDTALALATDGSKACNRRVEVRAFL